VTTIWDNVEQYGTTLFQQIQYLIIRNRRKCIWLRFSLSIIIVVVLSYDKVTEPKK